ncbi:MAG: ATP-binding protein [Spirochaetia bacterium]|jgi:ATP-dependent DNA helicase RecG
MTTSADFKGLLQAPEGSRLECKQAKNNYDFDDLMRYCVALANEGGGKIILGVTDKRPRHVVGTQAFAEPGETEARLFEQLHHRISIEELHHEGARVLIFHVPPRLPGTAWQYKGAFLMRMGDALLSMTDDQLRKIHEEAGPDFSASICPGASMSDIDPGAVDVFREMWQRKSPQQDISRRSTEQLLVDAKLTLNGEITHAALILLGTRQALGRFLGQAEIIFEYRSSEIPGPASERREFRQGFLPILDHVWTLVNLRNDLQHFQEGLFVWDVPTFDERTIREAMLNAVSHRDYRNGGSVFVRQFPRRIEIISPGGFPPGITPDNILWQQQPRNRRIAEALARCGLVERAGQGFDLIYRECIRQSKLLPDFTHTDANQVSITLHGNIQDPEFLRFLEQIGRERTATFSTEDLLVIDLVHHEHDVSEPLKSRLVHLMDEGVIERVGKGKSTRYLLSRSFYRFLGKSGVYTRKRGLDRNTNKALLLKHIQDNQDTGSKMETLKQVLPSKSRNQIHDLLKALKNEGAIHIHGITKAALWYPGPEKPDCVHSLRKTQ